jgi:hypothetical protein
LLSCEDFFFPRAYIASAARLEPQPTSQLVEEDTPMKLDVDERANELALEIWNNLYRKTADLRPGYTEEFIRRMWLIAVTKVLAEIEELIRRYDSEDPPVNP